MPNAKDAILTAPHRFLMLGYTGGGKTTQFATLPGKKYMHIFDQNALLSLRGLDVDYDEYMPDPVGAAAGSMSKDKKGDKSLNSASQTYMRFEQEFNERMQAGFFDQYDWIGFDSATTLLDLIMDRVLTINGRFGQWPHQDDHGPVMLAFTNICRNITAMGKGIFMTGHLETRQDQITKRIETRPMLTGRLVVKTPLLFSDIFICDSTLDKDNKQRFRIQTVPNDEIKTVRCSIKGLNAFEDVTINFAEPVEGQGLGGILNWEKKQLSGTS